MRSMATWAVPVLGLGVEGGSSEPRPPAGWREAAGSPATCAISRTKASGVYSETKADLRRRMPCAYTGQAFHAIGQAPAQTETER